MFETQKVRRHDKSGMNDLNIEANASPKMDRTGCPGE